MRWNFWWGAELVVVAAGGWYRRVPVEAPEFGQHLGRRGHSRLDRLEAPPLGRPEATPMRGTSKQVKGSQKPKEPQGRLGPATGTCGVGLDEDEVETRPGADLASGWAGAVWCRGRPRSLAQG